MLSFDRFLTPKILLLLSILILYVLYFIPSLVVIYQQLPDSDANIPGLSVPSISHISQRAYLRVGQRIHTAKCNYINAKWASAPLENLFWIWKHTPLLLTAPLIVFVGIYLIVYKPSYISFFLAVVISFIAAMVIFYLLDDTSLSSRFCDPVPVLIIKRAFPFWPAALLWIGSLGAGIFALRKLKGMGVAI